MTALEKENQLYGGVPDDVTEGDCRSGAAAATVRSEGEVREEGGWLEVNSFGLKFDFAIKHSKRGTKGGGEGKDLGVVTHRTMTTSDLRTVHF